MINESTRLYYTDSYATSFQATVTDCRPNNSQYEITLNQTLFYPEGGGQPSDIGTLNDATVTHVKEKNGIIIHITDKPLDIGSTVTGTINWDHRYMLMQNHTGEHIVSGIIHSTYGFDNVGFHMGSEFITLDMSGYLSPDDIKLIETKANEAIYKNITLDIFYPSAEELKALEYRSKKELEGQVRIVRIPGYDMCACCGTHTRTTGEVGIIKLITSQKYKSGTRIYMLSGKRALDDYSAKNESIYAISNLLSAKPHEVSVAVNKLLETNNELKLELNKLKEEIISLKAEKLSLDSKKAIVFDDSLSPSDIRLYCTILLKSTETALVLSGNDTEGYKYVIGSNTNDCRALSKDANSKLSGRGGGTKEMAQGSFGSTKEQIEEYFSQI